ncbi:hypothetical protein K438DRAFT_1975750 [Mycena galopus ATCC 62051]|nr:hypothetical protein K438DRAFT_1975750 [Mycena galopus ATCC 62051]
MFTSSLALTKHSSPSRSAYASATVPLSFPSGGGGGAAQVDARAREWDDGTTGSSSVSTSLLHMPLLFVDTECVVELELWCAFVCEKVDAATCEALDTAYDEGAVGSTIETPTHCQRAVCTLMQSLSSVTPNAVLQLCLQLLLPQQLSLLIQTIHLTLRLNCRTIPVRSY